MKRRRTDGRRRGVGLIAVALLLGASGVVTAEPAPCDGRQAWPYLGFETLTCPGGPCGLSAVDDAAADARPVFRFATEPRLSEIDPGGPGAGILQEGDVLVAVNGFLITSRKGGETLAALPIGEPAEISLRRGARLVTVQIRPTSSCDPPLSLSSLRLSVPPPRTADRRGPSIGMLLECHRCRFNFADLDRPWWGPSNPRRVVRVDRSGLAYDAGLRAGDILTHVDSVSLERREANENLFRHLMVGLPVERRLHLMYRRGPEVGEAVLQIPARSGKSWSHKRERRNWQDKLDRLWTRLFGREERPDPSVWIPDLAGIQGSSWGPGHLGVLFKTYPGFSLDTVVERGTGKSDWNAPEYLEVAAVRPDGAAQRAGIQVGDLVTAVNGRDVRSAQGGYLLMNVREGQRCDLTLVRDGQELTITVKAD